MSENIKPEDLVETPVTSTEATAEETVENPEQDLLKPELEKVKNSGRTEAEKASFSLKKNAERARELGIDPMAVLGIKAEPKDETDDDRPLTIGEYKRIQATQSSKTALQMADDITDASERELVKHYLENRIVPSGNPNEDFRDARRAVNSVKNELIIQEQTRKNPAKTHSNASSGPAKGTTQEPELTPAELQLMKFGHLTKEEVLKARQS